MCAAVHGKVRWAAIKEEIQLGSGLNEEQRFRVLNVVSKHLKCFPSDGKLGSTSLVEFSIDTGDAKLQRSNPIRTSYSERKVIAQKVEEFVRQGLARPSTSPWAASVVLVKKKDQDFRFCVDYQRINSVSKRDVYPLPRIGDVLDDWLERNGLPVSISSADTTRSRWQKKIERRPRSSHRTVCMSLHECRKEFIMVQRASSA